MRDFQGGHVNTWVDPATGRGFDAGVQSYIELPGAIPFFNRFNISTGPNVRVANQPIYVDFTSGTRLSNYTPPSAADRTDGLKRYLALAEQYLPVMEPGWWSFPEPKDIPADLLLPFRDIIAKFNLTSGVPQIFATNGIGIHDILSSPSMWVMRSLNVDMMRTLLGITPGFVPLSRKNQDLYNAILRLLGSDVLPSTMVVDAERSDKDGIVLKVRNSKSGELIRIETKKLLYTIPPTEDSLTPFNPDRQERSTLTKFGYTRSYVGVVSHPSLPLNTAIINTPIAAEPSNWLSSIPVAPFNSRFDNYANSSYYRVVATGDESFTKSEAQKLITDSFNKMVDTGVIAQTHPPHELKFHLFAGHGRVSAYASTKNVKEGFIQKLNALQGKKSTWYTGAAWSVHISTSLWVFTDTLLPKLIASLK